MGVHGVTTKAIIQRINRKLIKSDLKLRTSRSQSMIMQVGDFYIENYRTRLIVDKFVSIEECAKEYDCLNHNETITD